MATPALEGELSLLPFREGRSADSGVPFHPTTVEGEGITRSSSLEAISDLKSQLLDVGGEVRILRENALRAPHQAGGNHKDVHNKDCPYGRGLFPVQRIAWTGRKPHHVGQP